MTPPVARLVAHGSPEYDALVDLRRRVLRLPIGLDFSPEELAAERDQLHIGVFADGVVAACATLVPGEGTGKVRQVAVEPHHQGHGLGTFVMEWAETKARGLGLGTIAVHARGAAVPFYERLGYRTEGAEFTEVGLPHRRMTKAL
ncbi:GNAT family N-acetyltransferase [bacterium]|nr:MAG: GNAT family N-acetyltransferase [bacterium]